MNETGEAHILAGHPRSLHFKLRFRDPSVQQTRPNSREGSGPAAVPWVLRGPADEHLCAQRACVLGGRAGFGQTPGAESAVPCANIKNAEKGDGQAGGAMWSLQRHGSQKASLAWEVRKQAGQCSGDRGTSKGEWVRQAPRRECLLC